MPPMAPITDANPTVEQMESRVARFAALRPTDDYVDAGIPGCERTTFRVLGVRPDAPLAVEEFHLNIVRCAPQKAAPLHNHLTQEVFMPLTGVWEVFWGPAGERSVRLDAWDTVTVPPGVSRGFRNVGDTEAYLVGIAGGRDPGRINWPESVRAAALAVGVALPSAEAPGTHGQPAAAAQISAAAMNATPPPLIAVDHIHVFVSDRAASETWYRAVLGLTPVHELESWAADGGPLTISNPPGSVRLALFERPAEKCRSTIALSVSAHGFLAWQRHLSTLLEQRVDAVDHKMSWSLYFSDPDGNPFEITSYEYAQVRAAMRGHGEAPTWKNLD